MDVTRVKEVLFRKCIQHQNCKVRYGVWWLIPFWGTWASWANKSFPSVSSEDRFYSTWWEGLITWGPHGGQGLHLSVLCTRSEFICKQPSPPSKKTKQNVPSKVSHMAKVSVLFSHQYSQFNLFIHEWCSKNGISSDYIKRQVMGRRKEGGREHASSDKLLCAHCPPAVNPFPG